MDNFIFIKCYTYIHKWQMDMTITSANYDTCKNIFPLSVVLWEKLTGMERVVCLTTLYALYRSCNKAKEPR
jgi:hypothetical protein